MELGRDWRTRRGRGTKTSTPDQEAGEEQEVGDGATLMTIVRAKHEDFSDFPLLMPSFSFRIPFFSTSSTSGKPSASPSASYPSPSLHLHDVIQTLSLAFMRDGLAEELGRETRRGKEVFDPKEKGGKGKGKQVLVGEFGEVLVHT